MASKKKIKTYGVRNLMEWVCNIPVGKGHMRIEFTGGVLTSYGNSPAKFVTSDLLQQTIIEHSDFFKKKRIILLSVVESDEDEDRVSGTTPSPGSSSLTSASSPAESGEGGSDGDGGSVERDDDGKLVVEVGSLDDAKAYLNEKFGIAVRNLRSKASILEAASENGIKFVNVEVD